jgi:hypothetical protein
LGVKVYHIELAPIGYQVLRNKVRRAAGRRYSLDYAEGCLTNCPAGCGARYYCDVLIVDRETDRAVARLYWYEVVRCVCYETYCDPDRREIVGEIRLEDYGLPEDKRSNLEKVVNEVNARLRGASANHQHAR